MQISELTDSTPILGDPVAIRKRYAEDGVLLFRNVIDTEVLAWAERRYKEALESEGLIEPSAEKPVWTGAVSSARRPCDTLGTEVWHKIVALPELNDILRDVLDADPVWIPIAAHRSGLPTGPIEPESDIFAGRHQDGFYNEGMLFTICWLPIRDVDRDHGSFAVAPGTHHHGVLHDATQAGNPIPRDAIPESAWRSADFKAGDVLIFNYLTAHTALPNPSDEIRLSLDVRAIPAWAPQPIIGTVTRLDGPEVTISTEEGDTRTVLVDESTLVRDMNPLEPMTMADLSRIASLGAHVMAMTRKDGSVSVLRRNYY